VALAGTVGKYERRKPVSAPKRRSRRKQFIKDMDAIHIVALILTVYVLFFRIVVVVGPSMYDTLIQGDRLLLVSSLVYNDPKQGDIVVCSKASFDDGAGFVKRVIATEGQTVDIDFDAGIVYVDGTALDEPYIHTSTTREEGIEFPVTVKKGHVFVMGDNRERSTDSRSPMIGLVDERQIIGKAIFILSPGDNGGKEKPRFDRIGWIG
jgi:signal peptidase I